MTRPPPTAGLAAAYAQSSTIEIPQEWSTDQALAVWEFLDELTRRVWERYEIQLVERFQAELEDDNPAQLDLFDTDDPIEF